MAKGVRPVRKSTVWVVLDDGGNISSIHATAASAQAWGHDARVQARALYDLGIGKD